MRAKAFIMILPVKPLLFDDQVSFHNFRHVSFKYWYSVLSFLSTRTCGDYGIKTNAFWHQKNAVFSSFFFFSLYFHLLLLLLFLGFTFTSLSDPFITISLLKLLLLRKHYLSFSHPQMEIHLKHCTKSSENLISFMMSTLSFIHSLYICYVAVVVNGVPMALYGFRSSQVVFKPLSSFSLWISLLRYALQFPSFIILPRSVSQKVTSTKGKVRHLCESANFWIRPCQFPELAAIRLRCIQYAARQVDTPIKVTRLLSNNERKDYCTDNLTLKLTCPHLINIFLLCFLLPQEADHLFFLLSIFIGLLQYFTGAWKRLSWECDIYSFTSPHKQKCFIFDNLWSSDIRLW